MVMVPRLTSVTLRTLRAVSIFAMSPSWLRAMAPMAQQFRVVSSTRPEVVRMVEVISNTWSSPLSPSTMSFVLVSVTPDSSVTKTSSSSSGMMMGSSSSVQAEMPNNNATDKAHRRMATLLLMMFFLFIIVV